MNEVGSQLRQFKAVQLSAGRDANHLFLSLADKFSSHPLDVAVIDPEIHGCPLKSEKMAPVFRLGRSSASLQPLSSRRLPVKNALICASVQQRLGF